MLCRGIAWVCLVFALVSTWVAAIPEARGAERIITTVAGTDWLFPGDGRPAINAPLGGSFQGLDVAVDGKGNYYIGDGDNNMLMRVGPDGIINVIAGNGVNFSSGEGGLAVNAGLGSPATITVDSGGSIYTIDLGRVRKVTPDGIITTVAGTGDNGFSGDNGPATKAVLNFPEGLAVDFAGNVYIADTGNHRIRKVTPDGMITTIAGNGQRGFSGDNGPATSAQLNTPSRIAVDSGGNVYIVEFLNLRIRKVDSSGMITTVAGGGKDLSDGIPATRAVVLPEAIALDSAGNLLIAGGFVLVDSAGNESLAAGIRKVDKQGQISTIAGGPIGFGGDGGPARQALFQFAGTPGLTVDPAGNIFVADDGNRRIREITADGTINTIAGNGLYHFSGNGGPATSATLDAPNGVVADAGGNIYLTEPFSNRIRRITPDGVINVLAGGGPSGYSGDGGPATAAALSSPDYLALDPNGNLYFSDAENDVIRRIDSNGIITTYAGTGNPGFSADGTSPSEATFSIPEGIDFDSTGDLFIADSFDHAIRVVLPDGHTPLGACKDSLSCVLTLAGDGQAGFSGDGGLATKAELNYPLGVRYHNGSVYFADSMNNRIRKIDLATGVITTVAGNGQEGVSGDGGPATQASLDNPYTVAFDADGNMYTTDIVNVRKVAPDGTISTFLRGFNSRALGDGGPLSAAHVNGPTDIFVDSTGNILIADQFFDRIRAVLTTLPSFQTNPTNLAFTAQAGSNPTDQGLDLVGSIPGVPFNASATSNGGWLQVSSPSGTMPTTLRIIADPSHLAAGSYQGTVSIVAPNANPSSQVISVALTVTDAGQPSLSVKPTSMTFAFVQQAPAVTRPVSISNAGGGSLGFTIAVATASGGSWLSASTASGTVGPFASATVNITADPTSLRLAPGTYSATITVSSASPAQRVILPVTMTVSAVSQTILIPQTGLTFFAVEGGGLAVPQFFSILNTGRGQMPFTTRASTLSGGSWLAVFPANGVSDAQSPIVPQVRLDVNPAGLTAGIYYGSVQVTASGADNNPQFVSVILNVLPTGTNIGPIVQPTGLIFVGVAGAEAPSSQTVLVQNISSTPVTFHSERDTFLTALPSDGTITQAQPVRIVIQPQTAGLAADIYEGALALSFSDGTTRNIALVVVLIPPGGSRASLSSFAAAQAACSPSTLAPVFTQLSDGFSIPAGFPGQVTVKVIDDCANPQTTGGVTTSFSNGDPAIRLISLKDGTWAGTWTPEHRTPQIAVIARAEIPEQNISGQVQIKGGFQTFDPPPVIASGAVVNAASLSQQAPLAPGSMISIFGSKLAQGQDSAKGTLPTMLAGSMVLLAGQSAPLMFASDAQVTAIVPYGLSVNTTQQVLVQRGSSLSVPQSITVAAAAPGIFTKDGSGQGQGSIFKLAADGSQTLADPANPVKVGDNIVIYCTGLGEVTPAVPAGTPAPMTQLSSTVNQPSVNVGGIQAKFVSSILAPGFVGMYQVQAVVPDGITAGGQVPVIITAAGQPSQPVTMAVR